MARKKVLKKQPPSEKEQAKKKASRKPVSKKALIRKTKAKKATSKKTPTKKSGTSTSVTKKVVVKKTTTKKVTKKVTTKISATDAAAAVAKVGTTKVGTAKVKPAPAASVMKATPAKPTPPRPVVPRPAPARAAAPSSNGDAKTAVRFAPGRGVRRRTKPIVRPVVASPRPSVVGTRRPAVGASSGGKVGPASKALASAVRPAVIGKVSRAAVASAEEALKHRLTLPAADDSIVIFKRKSGATVSAEVLRGVLRDLEFVAIRHKGDTPAGKVGTMRPARPRGKHPLDALVQFPAKQAPREFAPVDRQMTALLRGTSEVFNAEELRRKLERSRTTNTPLRVKLGLDPSRPDIHIGHTVVLRKLRQFQDLGHQAVIIIGDYTAMVGDPSGKSKTRPILTEQEVADSARTYFDQIGSVLDTKSLEVRRNGEWFGSMGFGDVMKLAAQVTVARILERDDFSRRYVAQAPISLHEFFYPVMQGYDSVAVRADVELGGTDQTFNLLMGRRMLEDAGLPPQVCLTTPLAVGLDGTEKMSKSLGNAIGVREVPDEMYGKTMSIPDVLMRQWFELLTEVPSAEVAALCDATRTSPRDAKDRLAQEIVKQFHGEAAAKRASEEFVRRFREQQLPTDIPTHAPSARPIGIVSLLVETGSATSSSEARRLIEQGGVRLIAPGAADATGELVTDLKATVAVPSGTVLRAGKRRFVRLT